MPYVDSLSRPSRVTFCSLLPESISTMEPIPIPRRYLRWARATADSIFLASMVMSRLSSPFWQFPQLPHSPGASSPKYSSR